jgi:hypothetical protein
VKGKSKTKCETCFDFDMFNNEMSLKI